MSDTSLAKLAKLDRQRLLKKLAEIDALRRFVIALLRSKRASRKAVSS